MTLVFTMTLTVLSFSSASASGRVSPPIEELQQLTMDEQQANPKVFGIAITPTTKLNLNVRFDQTLAPILNSIDACKSGAIKLALDAGSLGAVREVTATLSKPECGSASLGRIRTDRTWTNGAVDVVNSFYSIDRILESVLSIFISPGEAQEYQTHIALDNDRDMTVVLGQLESGGFYVTVINEDVRNRIVATITLDEQLQFSGQVHVDLQDGTSEVVMRDGVIEFTSGGQRVEYNMETNDFDFEQGGEVGALKVSMKQGRPVLIQQGLYIAEDEHGNQRKGYCNHVTIDLNRGQTKIVPM